MGNVNKNRELKCVTYRFEFFFLVLLLLVNSVIVDQSSLFSRYRFINEIKLVRVSPFSPFLATKKPSRSSSQIQNEKIDKQSCESLAAFSFASANRRGWGPFRWRHIRPHLNLGENVIK